MNKNKVKHYLIDNVELMSEWDWEKNNAEKLNPNILTHGCTKKAHWICDKKHKFIARIDHRCIMKSGCPYCAGNLPVLGENDLATLHPDLLDEWVFSKNSLTPQQFKESSNKKVWWKCKHCQFEWKAAIYHRAVKNSGCPECAKKVRADNRIKTYVKQNGSLLEKYPDIVNSWNYELNHPFTPNNVTDKSNKKFWWVCSVCNNNYQMRVYNKTEGNGCPICAGKIVVKGYNDLATTHPELISEWNYTRNANIAPTMVTAGSGKYVWWKCKHCDFEWRTRLYSRTSRNSGCPACDNKVVVIGQNDLASTHPLLAKEWHKTKNNNLLPTAVTAGSQKKVWWKCRQGHEWQAIVSSRTSGRGCPRCAQKARVDARINKLLMQKGSLHNCYPQLAKEWHPDKNGILQPTEVTSGSDKKIWWQCVNGHEWKATISSRVAGNGCPECAKELSTSFPEQALLFYLSKVTKAENRTKLFGYEVDIYLPSLSTGIEYNSWYYHHARKTFDEKKQAELKKQGIRLIRIEECKNLEPEIITDTNKNIIYFKSLGKKNDFCKTILIELQKMLNLPVIDINLEKDETAIYSQYLAIKKRNSVALKHPWLLDEWNFDKNGQLSPWQVSYGSDKKVWWICQTCGYEWKAVVSSRKKCGCPKCAGRKV